MSSRRWYVPHGHSRSMLSTKQCLGLMLANVDILYHCPCSNTCPERTADLLRVQGLAPPPSLLPPLG